MSAILSADDLNDFITPGVACIKPIETIPVAPPAPAGSSSSLAHEVILDGTPGAAPVGTTKIANISLTDCLACSGCVTSAEAILVSLQSHSEVLSVLGAAPALQITNDTAIGGGAPTVRGLENPDSKILVASVAPQVLASLAAVLGNGPSAASASNMLTRFLAETLSQGGEHSNGFAYVVSTEPANEISLHLSALEVLSPSPTKPTPFNSMSKKPVAGAATIAVEGAQKPPLLASACPGWVCYAEKTHPYVLPHLSRVKSPQALTGVLLKSVLAKRLGVSPDRIWHLAIMPCFDKKLEAAREELTSLSWWDGHKQHQHKGFRDVDCVITSKEIFLLAEERGVDFLATSSSPMLSSAPSLLAPFPDDEIGGFLFPETETNNSTRSRKRRQHPKEAGASGGILHHILRCSSAQHAGSIIQTTRGRNADVVEYAVVDPLSEQVFFRAARYYGFRNIQNLVRRLKPARKSRLPGAKVGGAARRTGRFGTAATSAAAGGGAGGLEYAYVEVMACPGGCTNGGGQVKVDDQVVVERHGFEEKAGVQEQKAWLSLVDEAYFSASEDGVAVSTEKQEQVEQGSMDEMSPSSHVQPFLDYWAKMVGTDLDIMVYTSFREVVSDVGKEVNETERVIQLAGKIGGGW